MIFENKNDKINQQCNTNNTNNTNNNSEIKYILDPLSVIIKLFILSKKDIGCKLSIYNNNLYIQEIGIFQSFVRYYFNNTKIDLQYLYNPIEIACQNFLNSEFIKKYPKIKNLFLNSQKGLEKLIETYSDYTFITHTLYMYNNIISNHLGDKYNDKLFIKDNLSILYTEKIINKMITLWSENRIKILLNMVEFIDSANSSIESIKCLEEFMTSIDKEVKSLDIFNIII